MPGCESCPEIARRQDALVTQVIDPASAGSSMLLSDHTLPNDLAVMYRAMTNNCPGTDAATKPRGGIFGRLGLTKTVACCRSPQLNEPLYQKESA